MLLSLLLRSIKKWCFNNLAHLGLPWVWHTLDSTLRETTFGLTTGGGRTTFTICFGVGFFLRGDANPLPTGYSTFFSYHLVYLLNRKSNWSIGLHAEMKHVIATDHPEEHKQCLRVMEVPVTATRQHWKFVLFLFQLTKYSDILVLLWSS